MLLRAFDLNNYRIFIQGGLSKYNHFMNTCLMQLLIMMCLIYKVLMFM